MIRRRDPHGEALLAIAVGIIAAGVVLLVVVASIVARR